MNEQSFDALSRHAAEGVSRRGTLLTFGGAALAATFGTAAESEGKKDNNKKKRKKDWKKEKSDPFKKCKPQVEQCQIVLAPLAPTPAQSLCCKSFGTCDVTQFFLCLVAAGAA